MKLINHFKKQQKQKNIIEVKYSKLDHIGKVKRYEIPDKSEIDNQINNVNAGITNLNNELTDINNKVNTNINDIANVNNRINTNINNIATNVNNINNLNTKVNKITNDLANANLAEYKGIWVNNKTYKLGDLVSDNNTNNVYLSIINNNNNNLTDINSWKVITFTIDSSNFATKQELANTDSRVNTNTTNITTLKNRVDNIPTISPTQAIWREFNNKQINIYKKTISTPNKMFWYEINQQVFNNPITGLKPNKEYIYQVVIHTVNNKSVLWFVSNHRVSTNSNGVFSPNYNWQNLTTGFLSNYDFKPGGEGVFSTTISLSVCLWERSN